MIVGDVDYKVAEPNPSKETLFEAELRTVVTIFAKIHVNVTLGHSAEQDQALLSTLQNCMAIIVTSLKEHFGQLRQFMIDDKGCVAIGTFGLRSSVTADNAAAGIDTAHAVIARLQRIGLSASIGITTGKAYCGVVGASSRHEYSVMGRSVNLAARLMAAAKHGQVLVDHTIVDGNHKHTFVVRSEMKAKGYSLPVTAYSPIAISTADAQSLSPQPLEAKSYEVRQDESTFILDAVRSKRLQNDQAHFIVIGGPLGIGKTTFVNELWETMKKVSGSHVVSTKGSRQDIAIPLYLWRNVFKQLLKEIGTSGLHLPFDGSDPSAFYIQLGIQRVYSLLSSAYRDLLPLLGYVLMEDASKIVHNAVTQALLGPSRIRKAIELLSAVMQLACSILQEQQGADCRFSTQNRDYSRLIIVM
jgi:class 3 adenylate cyclase/energy-coupling factor transporter ATP-binding protein EcfA2